MMEKFSLSMQHPRDLLNDCNKQGWMWAELHGYRWFRTSFLGAIKALDTPLMSKKSRTLLANSYHLLGDIYYVLEAPESCIKAYLRAMFFNYRDSRLVQDIADVLEVLEERCKLQHYEIRNRHLARQVAKFIEGSRNNVWQQPRIPAIYVPKDPLWKARELLACRKPVAALKILENKKGIQAKRIRIMAYGALEDSSEVMREWSRIAKSSLEIELSSADWFFLPDQMWEQPKFWEIMLEMASRFFNFGLYSANGEIQGPPELLDKATKLSWHKIHRYVIEFHLARTIADARKLKKLCKMFPKWEDCHLALERLVITGKAPTRDDLLQESVL